MTFDPRSESNIRTLHPTAQGAAREWLRRCLEAGIPVKIICGTRTFEEQDALYEQGRNKPGPIVTKARGGFSFHNFGIAWDFAVFDNKGLPQWESPLMGKAGEIAESLGLEWGGRWQFADTGHVQLKTGLTLAQMRDRVAKGESAV